MTRVLLARVKIEITQGEEKINVTFKKTCAQTVYMSDNCDQECIDENDLQDQTDNSVMCETCMKWFHWCCVSYDENTSE